MTPKELTVGFYSCCQVSLIIIFRLFSSDTTLFLASLYELKFSMLGLNQVREASIFTSVSKNRNRY